MDFVWIYVESVSDYYKTNRFNELEYSMRSVRQNYPEAGRFIVVGDDPRLPNVIHIPVERIETSKHGYYRHFDQIKKLLAALDVVGEDFVLMYDDIYILNPVTTDDLTTVYAKCEITDLNEYFKKRKGDPSYRTCWLSTMQRIQEVRDDIYDWETHLPRYFNSALLRDIIEGFRLERVAYLSYSLYAGMFTDVPEIITPEVQSEVLEYTPLHMDWDAIMSAKFLNTNDPALSQEFFNKMKERFD